MDEQIRKEEIPREKGASSIEAIISLTVFSLVMMGLLMIVNFVTAQAKIQYAINATAKEMSQYAYFYHALGVDKLQDDLSKESKQAMDVFSNLTTCVSDASAEVQNISGDPKSYLQGLTKKENRDNAQAVVSEIQSVYANLKDIVKDPSSFIKSVASIGANYGIDYIKDKVIAVPLAKSLTRRHFGNDDASANARLEKLGIEGGFDGINFNRSEFIDEDNNVRIVVYYKINMKNVLPFNVSFVVKQQAVTRAWLGGDCQIKRTPLGTTEEGDT